MGSSRSARVTLPLTVTPDPENVNPGASSCFTFISSLLTCSTSTAFSLISPSMISYTSPLASLCAAFITCIALCNI
ncbi:hypothetical protein BC01_036 [Bacillus phage BC01]|nr:hypothetical protein BC01_036 [Bacillus phage BC01]